MEAALDCKLEIQMMWQFPCTAEFFDLYFFLHKGAKPGNYWEKCKQYKNHFIFSICYVRNKKEHMLYYSKASIIFMESLLF